MKKLFDKIFKSKRKRKWTAKNEELEKAFVAKEVHPMDLKNATAKYIDEFLQPIREHFKKNKEAKKLLEQVNSF